MDKVGEVVERILRPVDGTTAQTMEYAVRWTFAKSQQKGPHATTVLAERN